MLTKFSTTMKSLVSQVNFRLVIFTIMLVLLVLGAGAPGATGV
jgi:hypothetical protein